MAIQHFCALHQTPFFHHEKDGKEWYSHKIEGTNDYCNEPKEQQVQATQSTVFTPKPEEKVDWDAKDRQSLAQTAMKSASEIVAAVIMVSGSSYTPTSAREEVKTMANEFYKELKDMKVKL